MNILFTSAGRRSYLVEYFKESLRGDGEVYAANSSPISPAFLAADHFVVTPIIYDSNYIHFLLDYCRDNNIQILIPLFDVDLPILAKNKKQFEDIGVRVIVSDPDVIEICNDKWKTYLYLNAQGFMTPMTFISCNDAQQALRSGEVSFPLVIKPRWGMGSISLYIAENEKELSVFYDKVKNEIYKTYLKYESEADKDQCVIIQEKLEGQEYGLDVINDLNKNFRAAIVKKKIAMRAGETDCAVTAEDNRLVKLGGQIGKTLGHIANLDVDVFVCGDNTYILDMNARFGGGYPFSHLAGVDLPYAILQWSQGKEIDDAVLCVIPEVLGQKDMSIVRLNNTYDIGNDCI